MVSTLHENDDPFQFWKNAVSGYYELPHFLISKQSLSFLGPHLMHQLSAFTLQYNLSSPPSPQKNKKQENG